jgi:uncharacterized protein
MLVAFSGGVDSALVAVAAHRALGDAHMLAVLGVSPSLAASQHEQARAIGRDFGFPLLEVATDELADPGYVANAPDRCYYCKRELWARLGAVAAERGLAVVADGTNADDRGEHRPGQRAGFERGVVSPLVEAGLGKAAVRATARALGLPVWDAPAAPCLASRVLYGLEVTPRRLRQVEAAEAELRALGVVGDLRVRHRGSEARLEVAPDQFGQVRAARAAIVARLGALGFRRITLDLLGYRRGSLLASEVGELEMLGGDPGGGRETLRGDQPAG